MSRQNICCACFKLVKPGMSIKHEVCGHLMHAYCKEQSDPDFDYCDDCLNNPQKQKETQRTANVLEEPRCFLKDGRDYIEQPLIDEMGGLLSKIGNVFKRSDNDVRNTLSSGLPLKTLVAEYGCYLQCFLANGVTIDDFIKSGYTFNDLQETYPSDLGPHADNERYLNALYALGVDAEHFRAKRVPMNDKITPRDVIERFGLQFGPNCGILTSNAEILATEWSLSDLARLGFTVDDLFGAGLEYIEQYDQLSPDKKPQDAIKMGIKPSDIDQLPSYKEQQANTKVIYVKQRPSVKHVVYTTEPEPEPEPQPRYYQPPPPIKTKYIKRHHGLKK